MENPRILDTFLLTACQDGTVSCWTLNGAHVGQFGQGAAWNLDNETSFRSSSPEPLEHEHSAEYDSELDSESDTEYPEEVYSEYSLDEGVDELEELNRKIAEANDNTEMRLSLIGAAANVAACAPLQ